MGFANKSLEDLISYIDAGELVLPEIQRDFVWGKNNVLLLFDSLYRGLPIGTMLVWKAKFAVIAKKLVTKAKIGQALPNFYGYILDGQQRLTAIALVRDGSDQYPLVFALRPKDEADPNANRFAYKSKSNDNPWFVPVSDIMLGHITPFTKLQELVKLPEFVEGEQDAIWNSISKLSLILKYEIGVIEFEDNDYRKATELFIRFNSTGKKLNKSDLAASELALQVPRLISEGITKMANQYPSFPFTKPFLIQCLTAVHKNRLRFKQAKEIWDGSDEKGVKLSWKKTEKGIGRVIKLLTGTVKWDSISWLPSVNALIPLVYLLAERAFSAAQMKETRNWLLLASVNAIFSGAVHTKIDHILKGLKKDKSFEKLWNATRNDLYYMEPSDFETRMRKGSIMSLYVSMIRNQGAKDWKGMTLLDGSVVGHNACLQVHHFFPRSCLEKNGYSSDAINTFANYTILDAATNINISDKEPIDYLEEEGISKSQLELQCIPMNKELWRVDNYQRFLKERRALLAERANKFLDVKN